MHKEIFSLLEKTITGKSKIEKIMCGDMTQKHEKTNLVFSPYYRKIPSGDGRLIFDV